MNGRARHAPSDWLAIFPCCVGEIRIERATNGSFALCHRDDAGQSRLEVHRDPVAAIECGRYDDAGRYRPLKTARNLRHGWLLVVDPLERQTGIYRVAAKINEKQADELVGNFCRSNGGCLRTILWKRDETGALPSTLLPQGKFDPNFDQTGRGQRTLPLLCQEACNLLVAAARDVVKAGQ